MTYDESHNPRIGNAWDELLKEEFAAQYMRSLAALLKERRQSGAAIYPPADEVFSAFEMTPPARVRAVILGQDPYHNPGQAHGLAFSVRPGVIVPPSLRNIFKELQADLGLRVPSHGCLESWARVGVLLLNAVLTVEENRPGSHQGLGWERFTDRVIAQLSGGERSLVFMLWGAQAQKKGRGIDMRKHCVLKAAHPSPLSAYRGFLGCGHFSQANTFLAERGLPTIDWSL
ncbi:MAG: uracil-DNA glycosylase [Congregibacter sp.]|nr:uracil-DNA glycosylase [Congregibacter sp.]